MRADQLLENVPADVQSVYLLSVLLAVVHFTVLLTCDKCVLKVRIHN